MNPSTPGISAPSSRCDRSLSHRGIQAVVVHLGSCRHLRLQHLNLMGAQVLMRWIVRVLEICNLSRAGWTHLNAGRRHPLSEAVIAQRALVGGVGAWIKIAAAVRTCLHAVPASDAVVLVDQHDAVISA